MGGGGKTRRQKCNRNAVAFTPPPPVSPFFDVMKIGARPCQNPHPTGSSGQYTSREEGKKIGPRGDLPPPPTRSYRTRQVGWRRAMQAGGLEARFVWDAHGGGEGADTYAGELYPIKTISCLGHTRIEPPGHRVGRYSFLFLGTSHFLF